MKKVIIITGRSGFPNGFGAASILRKYGKGFFDLGYSPTILLLRPSENKNAKDILNISSKGVYNDINYEYMSKTPYTSNNLLVRQILYLIAILRCIIYIIKNYRKIEKVFFYSADFFMPTIIIQGLCNILHIRIIGIKTESSYSDLNRTKRFFWKSKEKLIYLSFSSMIVITTHLKEQLKSFGYNKEIKVLPIVVEEDMYSNCSSLKDKNSLIYMGTLNYREEIYNLINSLNLIKKVHKGIKLNIIGDFTNKSLENEIKIMVSNLNLTENIVWHGKIPAKEIPSKIFTGGIMLLPRVEDEYSKAGFPIKLGEYLLSGSPTVVTNTGDIEEYLTNKLNAFIVRPNDYQLFAEMVIDVLDNYNEALNVGENGKILAIDKFGVRKIAKIMMGC